MHILKISALMLACASGALALSPAHADWDKSGGPQARIEKICADQGSSQKFTEMQAVMAARIGVRLQLTDAQKAAFKDLQDTRAKAHADAKTALCSSKPDLSSFEGRLAFRGAMLQRRLDTFKAEEPKMLAFYNSLDEKQKKEFVEMREHMMHRMMERGGRHHGGGEGWGHHDRDDGGDEE